MTPQVIRSRDNPRLREVRRLLADPAGYRDGGRVWLEGEHLAQAAVARGQRLAWLAVTEPAWAAGGDALATLAQAADAVAVLDAGLMKGLTTLQSPPTVGALWSPPASAAPSGGLPTLVLDRLQDPGNAGSILRSAAALGVRQVLALQGTVALWSPKVLRAGQGAHFGLTLVEGLSPEALAATGLPLVATSSHGGQDVWAAQWPEPFAWVFGHEGQGVRPELLAACAARVRIPQPGGEESLNVAAAAAVCLYEALRRRSGGQ